MGNSHPGREMRFIERAFLDRDFAVKFRQQPGGQAMRMSEVRKKFGARVGSDKITPETFAPPGLTYQPPCPSPGIDVPTERSATTVSEAWRNRVRASSFEAPFPFGWLIQPTPNQSAVAPPSDVEQWKHIARKAGSGTQAFL